MTFPDLGLDLLRDRRACRLVLSTMQPLLEQADFVIVLCPLTPAAKRLIGARELRWMKLDAFLINVARGSIVDEEALIHALHGGMIGGASSGGNSYLAPVGHSWRRNAQNSR